MRFPQPLASQVRRGIGGLAFFCALTGADEAYAQQIHYVDENLTTGNDDGLTWGDALRGPQALQRGLAWASAGSDRTLLVAEGTYHTDPSMVWPVNSTDPRAGTFLLQPELQTDVKGGYLGGNSNMDPDAPDGSFHKTVLTGEQNVSYHVVVADSVTFGSVDGFRILDGAATGSTWNDSTGGGFWGRDLSAFFLEHCKIKSNVAARGGGIYYQGHGGDFSIRTCTVAENEAVHGGGMYVRGTTQKVELANVQFLDNGRGTLTQKGGGLYMEFEIALEAANCLFADNVAIDAGAGIYCDPDDDWNASDDHTWRHLTVAKNRLTGTNPNGAGIHYDWGHSAAVARLDNSIAWGNTGGLDLWVTTPGCTFTYQFCDLGTASGGTGGGGNISADPRFVNAAGGNFRLRDLVQGPPVSPCLDAASLTLLGNDFADVDEDTLFGEDLPWDLDETARVIDLPGLPGEVDMGAYEGPNALPPGQ